jgi:methionyl-tRNA synthetase
MHKLCKGKVPKLHLEKLDETDRAIIADIEASRLKVEAALEQFKFRDALYEVIDLSRKGNKYMQEREPWIKAKQVNKDGLLDAGAQGQIDNCLHICLQLTANLAVLINPFLPTTARKMLHMMKVVDKILDWENAGKIKLLSVGYSLRAPELLFRKIEDAEIVAQVEKLRSGLVKPQTERVTETSSGQQSQAPEIKPSIQYDDFAKLDFRVGTIKAAEKIEKADKLLKLEVDLGFERRTIVSGIALHYQPDAIIGKQVIVVANLAPRKMRGIESNGMILMAEDGEGKLKFINPDEFASNGSIVN